jgi:hypothetical protein
MEKSQQIESSSEENLKKIEKTLQTKISEMNELIFTLAKLSCKVEIDYIYVNTLGVGEHQSFSAKVFKRV